MPNNVNNYLLIEGDKRSLSDFFALTSGTSTADKKDFSFNAFIPTPNGLNNEEVINWRRRSWSTMWDCYEVKVTPPRVYFQTAWNVPRLVLIEISKRFPLLTIMDEWIEDLRESAGVVILRSGKILFSETEQGSAWEEKRSEYIHGLNMKYRSKDYLEYLKQIARDGGDEIAQFYLAKGLDELKFQLLS